MGPKTTCSKTLSSSHDFREIGTAEAPYAVCRHCGTEGPLLASVTRQRVKAAAKVRSFFERNPDRWFSATDLRRRLGSSAAARARDLARIHEVTTREGTTGDEEFLMHSPDTGTQPSLI